MIENPNGSVIKVSTKCPDSFPVSVSMEYVPPFGSGVVESDLYPFTEAVIDMLK